jgi:hypothetical protein
MLTLTRNAGVKELFTQTLPAISTNYQIVIFTNLPDPLYTWYAFYYQPSPFAFNQQLTGSKNSDFTYQNMVFSQLRCPAEILPESKNPYLLAINTEGCPQTKNTQKVGQVTRKSGGIPYTLWRYQSEDQKTTSSR